MDDKSQQAPSNASPIETKLDQMRQHYLHG
jgi:hypothetical protein